VHVSESPGVVEEWIVPPEKLPVEIFGVVVPVPDGASQIPE